MTFSIAWLFLAAQSIFAAILLALIGFPWNQSFRPSLERYRQNPLRLITLLVFFAVLALSTTWIRALIVTVDAAAFLELWQRLKAGGMRDFVLRLLRAAVYFFFGFVMILAY